jgi:hypothetical protein
MKDAEDAKEGDLKLTPTEDSEQAPAPEDIPSFSEWAQKQLAEAEKKKSECFTVPFYSCIKSLMYVKEFQFNLCVIQV